MEVLQLAKTGQRMTTCLSATLFLNSHAIAIRSHARGNVDFVAQISVSDEAHNQKVVGSNPIAATICDIRQALSRCHAPRSGIAAANA